MTDQPHPITWFHPPDRPVEGCTINIKPADDYARVFACPDGRLAVDLGFKRWLMIDPAGVMGVASGDISRDAIQMRIPTPKESTS
jgi:hypothetical protein